MFVQSVPYHIRLSPSFNAKIKHIILKNLAFSARKFLYKPFSIFQNDYILDSWMFKLVQKIHWRSKMMWDTLYSVYVLWDTLYSVYVLCMIPVVGSFSWFTWISGIHKIILLPPSPPLYSPLPSGPWTGSFYYPWPKIFE